MTPKFAEIGEYELEVIDILEEGERSIGFGDLLWRAKNYSNLATKALLASIDLKLLPEEWRSFILVTDPDRDATKSFSGRPILHCLVWNGQKRVEDGSWHPIRYYPKVGIDVRFRLICMRHKDQKLDSG